MSARARPRIVVIVVLLLALALLTLTAISAAARPVKWKHAHMTVTDAEFLGIVTYVTGSQFDGTEIGGFSGIAYDAHRGVYYVLSDDRSEINPSRFYTLDIDTSDGSLDDGDITFLKVTYLRDKNGNTFAERAIDPESIDLLRPGQIFISTEGDDDTDPMTDPFINRFNLPGKMNRELPIPGKFLYSDGGNSVRDNLGFESLTSTPNHRFIYAAVENALHMDGPRSTLTDPSPSRVVEFALGAKRPGREFIYMVDPIPVPPDPPGAFADHGLVEMQSIDNHGTFLAMERSFAVGVGNTILMYQTSIHAATDVSGIEALIPPSGPATAYDPMEKTLLFDFADLGVDPDNLEAMAIGPRMHDGRFPLIVVSDNNFNPNQTTQFILVALTIEPDMSH